MLGSINFITTILNMRCPGVRIIQSMAFSWLLFQGYLFVSLFGQYSLSLEG